MPRQQPRCNTQESFPTTALSWFSTLGAVFAAWGREEEARNILLELDELAHQKYTSQVFVAAIFAELGDTDRALTCLETAYEDRCTWLVRGMTVDPRLDCLRSETRFQNLARRMRLMQ